jgi:hypothetical protein
MRRLWIVQWIASSREYRMTPSKKNSLFIFHEIQQVGNKYVLSGIFQYLCDRLTHDHVPTLSSKNELSDLRLFRFKKCELTDLSYPDIRIFGNYLTPPPQTPNYTKISNS